MSLYDILLDDLVSKSKGKLNREEIDETMTLLSVAENLPKWRVLLTFGQAYAAYVGFEKSMQTLESMKGMAESELFQVRENMLQMGRE